jgi:hypothetical protein
MICANALKKVFAMVVPVLLASKGVLFYAASSVVGGVALGLMYKRFSTINQSQAEKIRQLQKKQQSLEDRLAALQPASPAPLAAEVMTGAVASARRTKVAESADSTKGAFLKNLLQSNLQLQAAM